MKKIALVIIFTLVFATSIFTRGVPDGTKTDTQAPQQVFIAAYSEGPGGNGAQVTIPFSSAAGHSSLLKMYSPLTILSKEASEIVPYAAESWESSADMKTWTFTLRSDMRFSDGRKITAQDVKDTAEYITHPEYRPENAADRNAWLSNVVGFREKIAGTINELTSIRVVGEYKIEFTLDVPNPRFFANCYRAYILPVYAFNFKPGNPMTTDWWVNPKVQVSSGPYKVGDFRKEEYLELVPNEHFFLGKPKLEKFIIKLFGGDITAAVLAMAAGDVMFSYVNYDDLAIMDEKKINIFPGSSDVIVFFDLNYKNLPDYWKDIRVRQAIMYAIDRKAIVKNIFKDTATVYPSLWAHPITYSDNLNWFDYNPEKAKQLLAEAGINPADIVIDIQSHAGYNNALNNAALQSMQQYLSRIGITKFSYRFLDVASWRTLYTKTGAWTIGFRGWGVPMYGADPNFQTSNSGGQGGDFRGYDFDNNGFPEVIKKVTAAPTNQEYFKALTALNELHNAQLPFLYMWVETRFGAALKTVKDFHWYPAAGGGPYLDDSHLWSIVR